MEIRIKIDGVEYDADEARMVAAVLGAATQREVEDAIRDATSN